MNIPAPTGDDDVLGAALWVVATPIGNLRDISARALAVLAQVDAIAAEDTRVTAQLLSHYSVQKPLLALHEHNEAKVVPQLVERMQQGQRIALVSDAGTPLISDPGYRLVRAAQTAELKISTAPGVCALTTALSVSGMATDRFHFEGFLAAKAASRRQRLQELSDYQHTLVFYESAHRVVASLTDMAAVFGGDREACLCRELTKRFETVRRSPLAELAAWVQADADQRRGELVLVVAGQAAADESIPAGAYRLFEQLRELMPPGKAARIAADTFGCSRRALYQQQIVDD
ncbi:MAG: 16S rRNA (cytidine(1402)-2'-O)-methyltransferase [Wenzhouxiangellaceae bacterium]